MTIPSLTTSALGVVVNCFTEELYRLIDSVPTTEVALKTARHNVSEMTTKKLANTNKRLEDLQANNTFVLEKLDIAQHGISAGGGSQVSYRHRLKPSAKGEFLLYEMR